jgi:hypothetical protein
MAGQPKRTFTLLDAMALVAATAIGFAWVRSNWYFYDYSWPWIDSVPEMLGPLLMTWTVAIVGLRLASPRPRIRRLALQPGSAACGAVAFTFLMKSLSYFVDVFARNKHIPWGMFRHRFVWVELIGNAIIGGPYHYVVTAVWGVLFLSRRCRPEPSWLDRIGRVIGLSWLLRALWISANHEISQWGNL